jgi:hypothetical protein
LPASKDSGYHQVTLQGTKVPFPALPMMQPDPPDQEPRRQTADWKPPAEVPRFRPLERFWPYVDLPQTPSEEELATLHPELRAALFEAPPLPFSVTLVFGPFDSPEYKQAVDLARAAAEYAETGAGAGLRHHARFLPSDALRMRGLWQVIGHLDSCEVLIDGQPIPYARELWLPLIWFLISE